MDKEVETNEPSDVLERVESMGSEAFFGGVDASEESVETKETAPVESTEGEKTDQVEKTDQTTETAKEEAKALDGSMTESERNAYFAQRRIDSKVNNDKYIESLKAEVPNLVNDVDESKFENMDEEQAEILKNAQKMTRQMEANEAIREVERTRETTAHSIIMAESQIPAFNSTDKDNYVGDELYQDILNDWASANAIIENDSNGEPQVVGIKDGAPSPYEFLEKKAKSLAAFSSKFEARAQSNVARNQARAEVTPVNNSSKLSSFDELEERVGDISLA